MTVLLPWFALVVTILAGWAIIKRLSTSMVLLFAGLAMISFAVICGVLHTLLFVSALNLWTLCPLRISFW